MSKTARSPRSSAAVVPLRRGTTLEMVRLACPDAAQANRISDSFGLATLNSDGIRDLHERLIIETAQALERLVREMHLSHEEIANRTGKDRTTITNMIRLLRLPSDVQLLVAERRLSMGHARAILGLPTPELQTQMAEKSAAQGYSVRQVERLVKKISEPREPSEKPLQDPNIKAAVRELDSSPATGQCVDLFTRGQHVSALCEGLALYTVG